MLAMIGAITGVLIKAAALSGTPGNAPAAQPSTPADRGAPISLGAITLPYDGRASVAVLDNGWIVLRTEPVEPTAARTGDSAGVKGVGGGASQTHGATYAFRLPTEGLQLAGNGSKWQLQATAPTPEEQRTSKPRVIAVQPRGDGCPCRSVMDLQGVLRIHATLDGTLELDARDEKSGRQFVATLDPTPGSEGPTPGNHATVSCNISCENGTNCSVSITCNDPPGCWAQCYCDEGGNATCISGSYAPGAYQPAP